MHRLRWGIFLQLKMIDLFALVLSSFNCVQVMKIYMPDNAFHLKK